MPLPWLYCKVCAHTMSQHNHPKGQPGKCCDMGCQCLRYMPESRRYKYFVGQQLSLNNWYIGRLLRPSGETTVQHR